MKLGHAQDGSVVKKLTESLLNAELDQTLVTSWFPS